MKVFVRPANESDTKNFVEWFSGMKSRSTELFQFPETYTLCAFRSGKILGYSVTHFGDGVQVLSRIVTNPKDSGIERALASSELTKSVITIGFMNSFSEIYFVGDNKGTNRIAEHEFEKIEYENYKHVFCEQPHPVYRLRLRDLE